MSKQESIDQKAIRAINEHGDKILLGAETIAAAIMELAVVIAGRPVEPVEAPPAPRMVIREND